MAEKKQAKKQKTPSKRWAKIAATVNALMPYILSVLFVVTLFSLMGFLGQGLKRVLLGVFSMFASSILAILMIYHALMWNYDVRRRICLRRVICSLLTVTCFAIMQHLIEIGSYFTTSGRELFNNGAGGHGGGFIGGGIGNFLYTRLGIIPAIIIVFVLLTFLLLQMFNITPAYMYRSIKGRGQPETKDKPRQKKLTRAEKRELKKQEKRIKKKKIAVFEDVDDDIGEIDDDTKEFLETTITTAKVQANAQAQEREEKKEYETVKKDDMTKSSFLQSSQLRPYDKERDEKRAQQPPEKKEEELEVVSSKYNDEEKESRNVIVETYQPPKKEEPPKAEEKPKEEKPEEAPVISIAPEQKEEKPQPVFELADDDDEEEYYEESEENGKSEEYYGENEDSDDDEIEAEELDGEDDGEYYEESDEDDEDYVEDEEYTEEEDEEIEEYEEYEEEEEEEEEELPPPQPERNERPVEVVVRPTIPERAPEQRKPAQPTPQPEEKPKPKPKPKKNYTFPSFSYLQTGDAYEDTEAIAEEMNEKANIIATTLSDFNARVKEVRCTRGPSVTRYEIVPAVGVSVKAIAKLEGDIALRLAAENIRMECPIPGKSAVGIEVPNKVPSMVYLRSLLDNDKFKNAKGKLTCGLGKGISGECIYADIEKTPHLLVAGATGMGKSVCINSLLVSLLYKATPDDLRLILIDPKRVELSNYNGIPHLLVPVVCEPKKSLGALQWAVNEMEERFATIEQAGVRNIGEFNTKVERGYEAEKMPFIVIVIDELADLKMAVPEIEEKITRLTQKARAAGIHLIIGTQRPSVDVITGLIKNNIPSRIAFRVPSYVDSKTILDEKGAEALVSRGDMLVKIVGAFKPVRVQGAYVSADEIQDIIDFWKQQSDENYDEEVIHQIEVNTAKLTKADKDYDDDGGVEDDGTFDPEFYNALEIAVEMGKISSSLLQRKLRLGFQRAARIIDQMEECGYIGESNGSKPRDVLITKADYQEIMMRRNDE